GHYSPMFYPGDFVYLLKRRPELIDSILGLDNVTILDSSVTVNKTIDGDSYHCSFHRTEGGCLLEQDERESICRHFVCPGINWESEPALAHWKTFFDQLFEYEIEINNRIAEIMRQKGFSLRDATGRREYFAQLLLAFAEIDANPPDFMRECPADETAVINRPITYGKDWPL
ncbi:MAG: hypothetical protein GXY34_03680, partial [Syntrophomonadaceae bacterium]|nr:hypothetical protein [Syntrophomonadaceae bacterium]